MNADLQAASPPRRWSDLLAITATGGFAGGGLLIGVAAGSRWLGMDPMVWQRGFWSEFTGFAVAIVPLFLISFVAMFVGRRADLEVPGARWWWTAGLLMWSANFVITSVYHLPVNIQLYSVPFSLEEADAVRTTWLALHVPRVVLAIGTHVCAVQAALHSRWAAGVRAGSS
jgi:hypothetical protein